MYNPINVFINKISVVCVGGKTLQLKTEFLMVHIGNKFLQINSGKEKCQKHP